MWWGLDSDQSSRPEAHASGGSVEPGAAEGSVSSCIGADGNRKTSYKTDCTCRLCWSQKPVKGTVEEYGVWGQKIKMASPL